MLNRRLFKPYLYTAFAIIMLISCWESNISNAAVVSPLIPKESIRLRILANSDTPEDQLIKRQVRDEIIKQMNAWVTSPQGMEGIHTLEGARKLVRLHLGELHQLVSQVLSQSGFVYENQVELAVVPFPTKVYGSQVYPAGDYEALRITLGKGAGLNWWCVLYPPLCFVNFSSTSDAITTKNDAAATNTTFPGQKHVNTYEQKHVNTDKEVKFFVWEAAKGLGGFFKALF